MNKAQNVGQTFAVRVKLYIPDANLWATATPEKVAALVKDAVTLALHPDDFRVLGVEAEVVHHGLTWLYADCPVCGSQYQFLPEYEPATCSKGYCISRWLRDPIFTRPRLKREAAQASRRRL